MSCATIPSSLIQHVRGSSAYVCKRSDIHTTVWPVKTILASLSEDLQCITFILQSTDSLHTTFTPDATARVDARLSNVKLVVYDV